MDCRTLYGNITKMKQNKLNKEVEKRFEKQIVEKLDILIGIIMKVPSPEYKKWLIYSEKFDKETKQYLANELARERKRIRREFIYEFCNDHNKPEIRWLRSIAYDMEDLLEKILDFFDKQLNN